jgi:hypothetical protein
MVSRPFIFYLGRLAEGFLNRDWAKGRNRFRGNDLTLIVADVDMAVVRGLELALHVVLDSRRFLECVSEKSRSPDVTNVQCLCNAGRIPPTTFQLSHQTDRIHGWPLSPGSTASPSQ